MSGFVFFNCGDFYKRKKFLLKAGNEKKERWPIRLNSFLDAKAKVKGKSTSLTGLILNCHFDGGGSVKKERKLHLSLTVY